ncbi:MAG: Mfa1 family fimbria major subunit [Tannerellaceae bacterium]|jgi:hypothetical protein|nr:Mfa1 family fimbria major subunit [Tannerellaceae bacterium]
MKKVFKFFMAASAITIVLTSCSQNEFPVNGDITPEPETSELATLTVNFSGGPATRAITDNNANADELKATSATIFVFNAQNSYQTDTTVSLPGPYSTPTGYAVTFNVPTGNAKRVYVGLNFTTPLRDSVRLNGLAALTYSIADQEGLFYASGNGNTPTFNGNLMFNDSTVIADIKPGQNTVNVNVERMASKITVKKQGELQQNTSITVSNATFDISTLEFAMGNKNTKILPMKEQTMTIDPNWKSDSVAVYQSDFQNEFSMRGVNFAQWDLGQFKRVDDLNTPITARQVKYALENTHEKPRPGEVTYVTIKVKFDPQVIATSFDDATKKPITVPSASVSKKDTLHVVIDNNTYYYYTARDTAAKHVLYLRQFLQDADYSTYYGQYCFYNVFLNSNPLGKEYQTRRNEFYDVGLEKISRLGRPYSELNPGESNQIIGATSSITVNISVNPWSLVDMGGQILGD